MARRYTKEELAAWINSQIEDSHKATMDWREEANRADEMVMAHQWDELDLQVMREERRAAITFNRTSPTIDAVYGQELTGRQRVSFIPMEVSLNQPDSAKAEFLTNAAEFYRRKAFAPFHESRAFRDCLICGVGATVDRVEYERDPDGEYRKERIDPLMCYWDATSTQTNMEDARWRAIVKLVPQTDLEDYFGKAKIEKATPTGLWQYWLNTSHNAPHDADNAWRYEPEDTGQFLNLTQYLPLVEFQWYEYETSYNAWLPMDRVQPGAPAQKVQLTEQQHNELRKSVDVPDFKSVKYKRRVYKRAFILGNVVLEDGPGPCESDFTIHFITGRYDRKLRSWVGLVRNMVGPLEADGPQQMANKLFSEIVHMMSTNSRGGLMAETDAFVNQLDAEERWAQSDSILWMRPGGINKVQEKSMNNYPTGLDKLMTWAVSAVPEVTGVSWEMLGLANREQANVLEANRKQSTLTMLADFFDALRMYRIATGRVLMYFISEIFAGDTPQDSPLIRIDSQLGQQVVPLLKDKIANKYDLFVDEAPSSPNVKQEVWGVLSTLLPHFAQLGLGMPPEVFDYLPVPIALANAWKQKAMPDPQAQQAQQQAQQLQMEQIMAEIAKTKADAQYKLAQAQDTETKAGFEAVLKQAEIAEKAVQIMGGGGMFGMNEDQMQPPENEGNKEGK